MNLLQVTVFLGTVFAVRGQIPTTICFPAAFQSIYFNLISGDNGTIYVNFDKSLWVEVSSVTGVRTLYDFTTLRTYTITGQGNNTACEWFKLRQDQIMYKCLPPYATAVPQATGYLHYYTNYRLQIYAYDIPTQYDTVFRIFIGFSTTYVPVMSQQFGYRGTTDMYIYVNPTTTISNQSVFTIPPVCQTRDVNLATFVG